MEGVMAVKQGVVVRTQFAVEDLRSFVSVMLV